MPQWASREETTALPPRERGVDAGSLTSQDAALVAGTRRESPVSGAFLLPRGAGATKGGARKSH